MSARMQAAILPGGRLHLNDGPIDLVIGANGARDEVRAAYAAATRRFVTVLDELCDELALLREEMRADAPLPGSPVARRMDVATRALCAERFITRMAAVAGAVADEVLAAMCAQASLARAYVNNGGDIALHLSPGAHFDVGLADDGRRLHPPLRGGSMQSIGAGCSTDGAAPHPLAHSSRATSPEERCGPSLLGSATIIHADPIRGIATSGRGGRSFSLGIADAVTVLAADAAGADAAATLVANAVDLPGHPAIVRRPACDLDPQSDLRERLVTCALGPLTRDEIADALAAGVQEATRLRGAGRLVAAVVSLQRVSRFVGPERDRVAPPLRPRNDAILRPSGDQQCQPTFASSSSSSRKPAARWAARSIRRRDAPPPSP